MVINTGPKIGDVQKLLSWVGDRLNVVQCTPKLATETDVNAACCAACLKVDVRSGTLNGPRGVELEFTGLCAVRFIASRPHSASRK